MANCKGRSVVPPVQRLRSVLGCLSAPSCEIPGLKTQAVLCGHFQGGHFLLLQLACCLPAYVPAYLPHCTPAGGFNPQFFPTLESVQALFGRPFTAASFLLHVLAINLIAARSAFIDGKQHLSCLAAAPLGELIEGRQRHGRQQRLSVCVSTTALCVLQVRSAACRPSTVCC